MSWDHEVWDCLPSRILMDPPITHRSTLLLSFKFTRTDPLWSGNSCLLGHCEFDLSESKSQFIVRHFVFLFWVYIVWWLILGINLTEPKDTQRAGKHYFWVYVWGYFQKSFIFELMNQVKQIQTTEGLNHQKGRRRKKSPSAWAETSIFSCQCSWFSSFWIQVRTYIITPLHTGSQAFEPRLNYTLAFLVL